jgi:hypothetical protein
VAQREVLHHARLDVYSTVAKLSSLNKVDMQEQMDGFQASKLQEEKENRINPGPDREISIWCNLLTSSLLCYFYEIWVLPESRVYHKELEGTKENGLPPHKVDFQCDLRK